MTILEKTVASIERIGHLTDTPILFCSFGKDSLVLLDLLTPRFKKVICVFMYFVKDLDHIERYIRWAQGKYPNIEVIQVPHWNLTYLLHTGFMCVAHPKVKIMKLSDVEKAIRLRYGVNYVFYGMKKADSLNRRLMLGTYSENYENLGKVYPLTDWTGKDVLAYMKQHKLPQPVRYSKRPSGGVGLNIDCFLWMRKNAPQDLKKVLKVFPMSEKILYEYDRQKEQEAGAPTKQA